MNFSNRMLLFAALSLMMCSCGGPHPERLSILHVNDTHSHSDPLRDGTAGVIERAAFVDSVRASRGEDNVLLLHAGDFSQGTSYFTILNGDLEIDLINDLRYDCVTLGNHEFDNGIEELGRRLAKIQCPVVVANYDLSTFEAGKKISPYAIVEKAGMKIGIVGLLTDITRVVARETADRIPRVGTDDFVLNHWAEYLKNECKCDLVIALTHIGYDEDQELAAKTHLVDVFIGGHSHTKTHDIKWVGNADGVMTPVVTDWCWGYEVGELTLSNAE